LDCGFTGTALADVAARVGILLWAELNAALDSKAAATSASVTHFRFLILDLLEWSEFVIRIVLRSAVNLPFFFFGTG